MTDRELVLIIPGAKHGSGAWSPRIGEVSADFLAVNYPAYEITYPFPPASCRTLFYRRCYDARNSQFA